MAEEKKDNDAFDDDDGLEPNSTLAISKNFFNFESMGPIESNVPVTDEIQSFIDVTMAATIIGAKKSVVNDLFGQIHNFFAVMAYNANLTSGEMRAADHGLLMTNTYTDLLSNLHMKEDFNEHFFSKWPDKKLPARYKIWCDDIFAQGKSNKDTALNSWIDKEASKYSSSSKDVKLKVYFGATLIADAIKAIGKIKAFHNRYYVPPGELASGKNMSGMYKAMKRQLLKVYAQEQGYNTLIKQSNWKDGSWSNEEKAQKIEIYRNKKLTEWETRGDHFFIPDYWLTFLLCSYPMEFQFPGKKMTLDCLVPPTVLETNSMIVTSGKTIRRAERVTAGKTKGTASASSSVSIVDVTAGGDGSVDDGSSSRNTFTFIHKREKPSSSSGGEALAAYLAELEQLKSNIALLGSLPGQTRNIDTLTQRMIEVIMEVSRLQKLHSDQISNSITSITNTTKRRRIIVASSPEENIPQLPHLTPSTVSSSYNVQCASAIYDGENDNSPMYYDNEVYKYQDGEDNNDPFSLDT